MYNVLNFTNPQKRILFSDILHPECEMSNVGYLLKLKRTLNVDLLQRAINNFVCNNPGIRIRLEQILDGDKTTVKQYVADYTFFEIDYVDFSHKSDEEILKYFLTINNKKIDVFNEDLFYFTIVKFSENECGFFLKAHHLVADGVSANIASEQIGYYYINGLSGCEFTPNLGASYLEFLQTEEDYYASTRFSTDKAYWLNKYETLPAEVKLSQTNHKDNSLKIRRKNYDFPQELTNKILKYKEENSVSLFNMFLEIVAVYIHKITANTDFTIAMPSHNRFDKKFRNSIGMFVSTIPFRIVLDSSLTLADFHKQIKRELLNDLKHQKYPFNFLVNDLRLKNGKIDNLLNIQLVEVPSLSCEDIEFVSNFTASYSTTELMLFIFVKNGLLEIGIDYQDDLFGEFEIDCLFQRLLGLFELYVSNRICQIVDIDIISDFEKEKILFEFNNPEISSQYELNINSWFEKIVNQYPEMIAVEDRIKSLTFGELNQKANTIAQTINHINNSESKIVALIIDNSIETIIAIMGIIKAGCGYLPIDPNYPSERISYILNDCGVTLILTGASYVKQYSEIYDVINLEDEALYLSRDISCFKIEQDCDTAYIIYTSGSTGKPKGVEITHKNLINYVKWGLDYYDLQDSLIFPLYSSISFDLTITSVFLPLLSGGKIIVYREDDFEATFERIFSDNKVNCVKLTPSHLKILQITKYQNSSVKQFIVGGEELTAELSCEIYNEFNQSIKIFNEYGPTETTVGCSIYQYNPQCDKDGSLLIGKPIENTQIMILDKDNRLLPIGGVGEICISGEGVAKGYYNNSEKTAQKFMVDPFNPNLRIYRSGDLGRWNFDGNLEYFGREDNQVKIRGYRIELDEISNVIRSYNGVIDAVAVERLMGDTEKGLYAYFVADKHIDISLLYMHISQNLPQYMIPNHCQQIEKIPLTINGKLNKEELPAVISAEKHISHTNAQPIDRVEELMLLSWKEVFNINEIDVEDNFFELGGDSIKAIQIVSSLRNRGLKAKVKDILTHLKIRNIRSHVEVLEEAFYNIEPLKGDKQLIPIEKWFFANNLKNQGYYNQTILLKFKVKLLIDLLNRSFNDIVSYHDGLRINYRHDNNSAFYNDKHLSGFKIAEETINYQNNEEKELIIGLIKQKYGCSFDLTKDLLFKVVLIKDLTLEQDYLLLIAHHLVVDGVSWRIILEDFYKIYSHYQNDNSPYIFSSKTVSLASFAKSLHEFAETNNFSVQKDYWQEVVNTEFELVLDRETSDWRAVNSVLITQNYDTNKTRYFLDNLYSKHNLEFSPVLLLALARVIAKWQKKNCFLIELEGHGRNFNDLDTSRTTGWFTSIYPVKLNIEGDNLKDQLKYIKNRLKKAEFNNLSFGLLKELLLENKSSLAEVRFNFLGVFDKEVSNNFYEYELKHSGIDFSLENNLTAKIEFDLMVVDSSLHISVRYNSLAFNDDTIDFVLKLYFTELDEIYTHLQNGDEKYYTKSDFDTVDLDDADLELLFS